MKEKLTRWNMADYLKTEEDMAHYLATAVEDADEDPLAIPCALGDIARARGMTNIAKETGLTRAALYKSLSGEGNPEFSTILKVAKALGFRLQMTPI